MKRLGIVLVVFSVIATLLMQLLICIRLSALSTQLGHLSSNAQTIGNQTQAIGSHTSQIQHNLSNAVWSGVPIRSSENTANRWLVQDLNPLPVKIIE